LDAFYDAGHDGYLVHLCSHCQVGIYYLFGEPEEMLEAFRRGL
jgi:hypothetical protein